MYKSVKRRQQTAALLVGLWAVAGKGGCEIFPKPDYEAIQSELHFEYLEAENALRVLEIQRGLVADDSGEAADALEKLVGGWRRFPPDGGFPSYDLDDLDSWISEDEPPEYEELWALVRQLASQTRIEDAGLFLDHGNRLSFYRVTRVGDISAFLNLINETINVEYREAGEQRREFEPEFPMFDRRTFELFGFATDRGHAWLRTEGERIVVNAPMTEENAAHCLSHLLRTTSEPDGQRTVDLYSYLRSMKVADETVELRFGPAADGWFHYIGDPTGETYEPEIIEELRKRGHSFDDAPSLADVRATMDRQGK